MLNMDPVVQINVSVGASSIIPGVFDIGAILTATAGTANGTGNGAVLSTTHRFASYDSLSEVANGVTNVKPSFGTSTDVYLAAAKFFGVSPNPTSLVVIFYDTASETTDTPTLAMLDAIDKGAQFYGVYYSPKSGETAANIKTNTLAIASALNSLNRGVLFYGVTGTSTQITDAEGLVQAMASAKAKRAVGVACTTDVDDAAGLMGVAMGYAKSAGDRAFALCYKTVATAAVNGFSQSEVAAIKAINGNVYVSRSRTHSGIENGATGSGLRFDDVLYLDMIAYDIQNSIYSMIAESPTKLPQEDSTTVLFISEINRILESYYNIGVLIETGWRGQAYDNLEEGMVVEHGYYAFANSFDTQSTADRNLHKAMPITVLLCLAGSVESVVINLDVQT